MIKQLTALAAVLVLGGVLMAGTAFGQESPSTDVYGGQAEQIGGGAVGGQTESGSDETGTAANQTQSSVPAGDDSSGSTLPFTGSDLGLVLLVGFVLFGAGLMVRRGVGASPTGT